MPRLRILDHNEINTLYKIPKFNHEEQVTFFTLTDEDVSYLKELDSNTLAKIDYMFSDNKKCRLAPEIIAAFSG